MEHFGERSIYRRYYLALIAMGKRSRWREAFATSRCVGLGAKSTPDSSCSVQLFCIWLNSLLVVVHIQVENSRQTSGKGDRFFQRIELRPEFAVEGNAADFDAIGYA